MQTDQNNELKVKDSKFDVSSIGDYEDTKTDLNKSFQMSSFSQKRKSSIRNEVSFFAGCTDGVSYKE